MKTLAELTNSAADATGSPAWAALAAHRRQIDATDLRALLDAPGRYAAFAHRAAGILLDLSRNRWTAQTEDLLLQLAAERNLDDWIAQLFSGGHVNNTEDRPAQHMALRLPPGAQRNVDGADIAGEVHAELDRFLGFADAVRDGTHTGATGERITDIVNIGIGGSDLGIVMVDTALAQYRDPGIQPHFVSNIDGAELADVLEHVDPARTLFIVCSKSFTTLETRLNADAARAWLLEHLPEDAVARHFVAVSTNGEAMDRFGIDPALRFRIWDWVGGRYSLWSAIGLSIAVSVGSAHFRELLAGAHAMDEHFRTAPANENLPTLLGLVGVWLHNFMGATSHAVLPYDSRLRRLPAYLQQLEMESNGKSVFRDGQPVDLGTGTVIWGEPGSNAQHSFFQLLHQGTAGVSLDFIAPIHGSSRYADQHLHGLANMLAQAEAFARGFTTAEARSALADAGHSDAEIERLAPHKRHAGGRSSSILLLDRLDPRHLGALIALYEYKVFVQSVIWGINPFDQWGVELGKVMAVKMTDALKKGDESGLPPVAAAILRGRTG